MANREIKTKVAIDGEKEYKESLKNINSAALLKKLFIRFLFLYSFL